MRNIILTEDEYKRLTVLLDNLLTRTKNGSAEYYLGACFQQGATARDTETLEALNRKLSKAERLL